MSKSDADERVDILNVDHLTTESVNPDSSKIDTFSSVEIVRLLNLEDSKAVDAVQLEEESIARAIDLVVSSFRQNGRLIYMGAGTSGRLGVLDASECPPTFGTDPSQVIGLIAGGERALRNPVEGAEDSPEQGAADLMALNPTSRDVVMGVATSGRTPYVIGGLELARKLGAATIGLVCNRPSSMDTYVDVMIAPIVGPEVLSGSTRMKAGTATKLVLNAITTGAMIRTGKTYGNRMVDLKPLNEKLRIRSRRILREIAGVDDETASELLSQTDGRLKPALVMALSGVNAETAERLLVENQGLVRMAAKSAETVEIQLNRISGKSR